MRNRIIYKIVIQTIAAQYYNSNAGFFFVLIVFVFGLLRNVEHIAIATYILRSSFLLYLLFALWALYTLKTIAFTKKAYSLPQNQFLYNLYLIPLPVRLMGLLLMQLILLAPVLLYTFLLVYVGFTIHIVLPLVWVSLFIIGSLIGTVVLYNTFLAQPNREQKLAAISRYVHLTYTKPYFTYVLSYLFTHHKTLLLGTKLCASVIVWGTIQLYIIEDYNIVLLYIGVLGGISTNAVIIYQAQQFEQVKCLLLKNMPVSLRKRFFYVISAYLMLLLPEISISIRYLFSIADEWLLIKLVLFDLSLLLIYHGYLLIKPIGLNLFIRHLFFITLFYFFALLNRTDILWLAIINLLVAYYLYKRYFYKYEPLTIAEE